MDSKENTRNEKVFVLDSSAIFNGILAQKLKEKKYIPYCVASEIQGVLRGEAILAEISLRKDIMQTSPIQKSISSVHQSALQTGDIEELSVCDIEVLALAHSLSLEGKKVEIISDDYDIQNLAFHMGIACRGIYWKGISSIYDYSWVCIGCGFKSNEALDYCSECGSPMKKKTFKRRIRKK
ncbi:MAG TPA: hypothetical protein VMX55_14560 [candidate division Zixibacteria bacterium]|nr:hypothetical protein [candidate division Zixibacteria bacterium]